MSEIIKVQDKKQKEQLAKLLVDSQKLLRNINSVKAARTAISPRISELIKAQGEEIIAHFIGDLISTLEDNINTKDRMTANQKANTAIRIIDKYKYFKVSDLVYVFNKIMDGEIKIYGSLTRQVIMGALFEHENLRSQR